jgi:hypothetical protein
MSCTQASLSVEEHYGVVVKVDDAGVRMAFLIYRGFG